MLPDMKLVYNSKVRNLRLYRRSSLLAYLVHSLVGFFLRYRRPKGVASVLIHEEYDLVTLGAVHTISSNYPNHI